MTADAQKLHGKIVRKLEEQVRKNYVMTAVEVEVRDPNTGRVVGEIDLVGMVNGVWDLYEVKVGDCYSKAVRQLRKLQKYLAEYGTINLYYYSGRFKQIVKVE